MKKNYEKLTTPPAYRIFSVTKEAVWQEIGAAWKHKDGKGLNLQFKALPLPTGEIVLREPLPPKTEGAKAKE
jgi:hypothetical protein